MDLSSILTSGPVIGGLITAGIAALLKMLKTVIEFHDDFLRKRPFKHYEYLVEQAKGNEDLLRFLISVKREAVFRVIYRRSVAPRMASALMELHRSECFSLADLRTCFFYTRQNDDGSLDVEPGWVGKFVLVTGGVLSVSMGVFCYQFATALVTLKSSDAILGALGVIAFFLIFLWFIGREVVEVLVARQCKMRLARLRVKNLNLPIMAPPQVQDL